MKKNGMVAMFLDSHYISECTLLNRLPLIRVIRTILSILPIALAVEAKSIWNDSTLNEGAEPFLVAAMLTGIALSVQGREDAAG